MLLNERGLYSEAVEVFESNDLALDGLIDQLQEKEKQALYSVSERTRSAVAGEWLGESKLAAFSSAKKHMRSESDHTGRSTGDWSDNVPD